MKGQWLFINPLIRQAISWGKTTWHWGRPLRRLEPPRWHRAWLAVWYPSTKHSLQFEPRWWNPRHPVISREDRCFKGSKHLFSRYDWRILDMLGIRSKTSDWYNGMMEFLIPSKWWFGKCISFQIWLFRVSVLHFGGIPPLQVHLKVAKQAVGSLEEHQSSLLYTEAGSLCMEIQRRMEKVALLETCLGNLV